MGIMLNNLFDTDVPFVDSLLIYLDGNNRLYDSKFAQACKEHGISESEAMQLMVVNKKVKFFRLGDGWNVSSFTGSD